MRQIKEWYLSDIEGEEVVSNMMYKGKKWDVTKEWIPNSVINNQISNQACVIGNGISRKDFNLRAVIGHFGGLLGRNKLQTFATNGYFRDAMKTGLYPDFLIATGTKDGILREISNSNYWSEHIVFTDLKHIVEYPGQFYHILQDPSLNAGAMAAMLAAGWNHKKVFLLGFDGNDSTHTHSNYNIYSGTANYQTDGHAQADPAFHDRAMRMVFDTYQKTEFIRVCPTKHFFIPELWRDVTNLRQITFREFILEADL
jgi:hypothetical protein